MVYEDILHYILFFKADTPISQEYEFMETCKRNYTTVTMVT